MAPYRKTPLTRPHQNSVLTTTVAAQASEPNIVISENVSFESENLLFFSLVVAKQEVYTKQKADFKNKINQINILKSAGQPQRSPTLKQQLVETARSKIHINQDSKILLDSPIFKDSSSIISSSQQERTKTQVQGKLSPSESHSSTYIDFRVLTFYCHIAVLPILSPRKQYLASGTIQPEESVSSAKSGNPRLHQKLSQGRYLMNSTNHVHQPTIMPLLQYSNDDLSQESRNTFNNTQVQRFLQTGRSGERNPALPVAVKFQQLSSSSQRL